MQNTCLSFDTKTEDYEIAYHDFAWVSQGRRPYIIIRKLIGTKNAYTYRPFFSASHKTHELQGQKIVSTYSGFFAFGKQLDFTLVCTAELLKNGEVDFTLDTENETDLDIQAVYYPAPFNSKETCRHSYTLDTARQGLLVPDNYLPNHFSIFLLSKHWRKVNTGDCYLPFWGRVCDNHGFISIIDTPYDATLHSSGGKKNSFLTSVNWMSSLGKIRYQRKLKMLFYNYCDYNTLCKSYRAYLKNKGELVTLNDKIKQNPAVKKLIGAPVLHCGIFSNIQPISKYYEKDGENQKVLASFSHRAEQYKKLKAMGLEHLYIHTDGWGELGYDNAHPYVLPPCPQAGGYEGMKQLAETCDDLGYSFGIHDQYRDQYFTCKKYDKAESVQNLNGSNPFCDIWAGGAHSWLCSDKALSYLKTTQEELEEHDVHVRGVYLDVFSIMWGDECFHPEHPMTREQSIQARRSCFDYLRNKGIIVSSEEPGGLMVNSLDLVHHAAYSTRPQEKGEAVGIPVPLNNLVLHDCVFVPWVAKSVLAWGVPKGDSGKLHCILNAQTPYIEPFENEDLLSDDALKTEIASVQELCAIQAELYNQEMMSHKFLNASRRKQQTTYGNGTVITVDFDTQSYTIERKQK